MDPNFWDITYCGCHLKNLNQSKCKTSNTNKNSKAISMRSRDDVSDVLMREILPRLELLA